MDRNQKRQRYSSMDGLLRPSIPQRQIQPRRIQRNNLTAITVSSGPLQTHEPEIKNTATPLQPPFRHYYYSSTNIDQPVKAPKRSKTKNRWSVRRKVLVPALAVLFIGLSLGSWFGMKLMDNVNKVFHGNVFSDVHALFINTKLKGEDQGRVNILLAGDSADDPNHGGADLTDSIMLLSIDPLNKTGFMLSIPRDLWVNIPGMSHQKINAANDVTNFSQAGYPSGGMGQLEEIVQTDLGIPIDYYALINYTAFRDAVNAVGGITINIQSPDPRGLFDPNIAKADGGPLKLPNGMVTLDGQTALNLARSRGDPCGCGQYEYGFPQSDYNRTQHQREMLSALAAKAQTIGVIANPIKISGLFNSFGNNIATDFNLQDILRLVQITKDMNVSNLQPLALANSGQNALLTNYTAPDGEEALIPKAGIDNFGQIRQYYQQLTSNNPVVKESPTVVVLNGGNQTGLAHKEATRLEAQGFNVLGAYDANSQYPSSMIVDLSNAQKPASAKLLQSELPKGSLFAADANGSKEAAEATNYTSDFVIVLGQDNKQPTAP